MRTKTQKVTIKLTPTEVLAIQDLLDRGRFDSVSAAIRAGLDDTFDKHCVHPHLLRAIHSERRIHAPRKRRRREKSIAIPQQAPARPEGKPLGEIFSETVYYTKPARS